MSFLIAYNGNNKDSMDELNKIIDRYTEGNYLIGKTAKEEMAKDILALFNVSQQRKLLIATIEKVRYNLDGYGALTSSEIAERLEKAINCG